MDRKASIDLSDKELSILINALNLDKRRLVNEEVASLDFEDMYTNCEKLQHKLIAKKIALKNLL